MSSDVSSNRFSMRSIRSSLAASTNPRYNTAAMTNSKYDTAVMFGGLHKPKV